jgi:hypothetical protein
MTGAEWPGLRLVGWRTPKVTFKSAVQPVRLRNCDTTLTEKMHVADPAIRICQITHTLVSRSNGLSNEDFCACPVTRKKSSRPCGETRRSVNLKANFPRLATLSFLLVTALRLELGRRGQGDHQSELSGAVA